jgi:NAD dependent epimerase/dehydratase family enzyme
MVDALIASQRAIPRRLLEKGFRFLYDNIENAFSDLL